MRSNSSANGVRIHVASQRGGLSPHQKFVFLRWSVPKFASNRSFQVRPRRNLPAPARGDPESWRRMWLHARDLGTPRALHSTHGHIGGGTALCAFEGGRPHSTRESIHIGPGPVGMGSPSTRLCTPDTVVGEKVNCAHNPFLFATGYVGGVGVEAPKSGQGRERLLLPPELFGALAEPAHPSHPSPAIPCPRALITPLSPSSQP